MAGDKTITQLDAILSVSNSDVLPIVDVSGNVTDKVTVSQLQAARPYYTVGSSNADYITDGIADEVQINQAIVDLIAAGGGTIFLKPGQYNIAAAIAITSSYINVIGAGTATLIKTAAGSNSNGFNVTGTGTINVAIRNMQIDGNRANNAFGSALHINTPWAGYDSDHVFEDLLLTNWNNNCVETALNADTRQMHFIRVHAKGADGNGFYFPWPSMTDCTFDTCIADTIALNGMYLGGANNHMVNCKVFYCGSAGGENFGFFILGYNNYWENCEAQDNYQGGFYGNAAYGDPTYSNFGNTFVNCIADSNNQNSNALYGCGFQGIGVNRWQIIGGISMSRPYYSFQQRLGVSFQSGANENYTSGVLYYANAIAGYSDTSTGVNYQAPGAGNFPWEVLGALDVRNYGAKGDTQRIFGAVSASSGGTTVTCAGAVFTSADIGKKVMVYKEQFYGNIRTIASINSTTSIELSGSVGATTASTTGYIVYGSDDSVIIQKVLTLAATYSRLGSLTDSNQPLGSGKVRVLLPGNPVASMYMLGSQITIPAGVILQADGHVANMLANRNTPCILMQVFTEIAKLELENLGGTGINAGTVNTQAQILFGDIRIWHGLGAQSGGANLVPLSPAATGSITGGTLPDATYYYVITAIDSTGGESWVSGEVSATISGGTNHGSVALTWTALSGSASYRIYRGTAAGVETVYFTSATNSYTDTNATSTAGIPTPPGYGMKLLGYEWHLQKLFIKECSVGVIHAQGSDFVCDSAFLVGCATPIQMYITNQARYNHVFLDSCGPTSIATSLGGIAIDNGCSDISFGNIQEFTLTGVSRTLSPIVNIGSLGGTANKDLRLTIQANNGGGTGLSLANAQDVVVDMMLSNVVFSSGATNAFTTGVAYGSSLTNEIRVSAIYSSTITPSSGTVVGTHSYQQAGFTSTNSLTTRATIVGSLPSASASGAGARSFVTDATATTFHSTVAGTGANAVPVVSDGTNWLIG